MINDKQIEYGRYNDRAKRILFEDGDKTDVGSLRWGSSAIPLTLRAPYIYYEQCIRRYISANHHVLEIGSGTGLHTMALLKTNAHVVASDISAYSLEVLKRRLKGQGRFQTATGDMEALPFKNQNFDVICSAGSLSYGDPWLVNREIFRLLKPGGIFICVDSLNHNPVYRFNRWLRYLKGERTKSALLRIPDMGRIKSIGKKFDMVNVKYFGGISFLMPFLERIIGSTKAAKFSDTFDRAFNIKYSAFKFVMVASKYRI